MRVGLGVSVCVWLAKKINGYSYCFTAIYHRMLSSARVVYFPGKDIDTESDTDSILWRSNGFWLAVSVISTSPFA